MHRLKGAPAAWPWPGVPAALGWGSRGPFVLSLLHTGFHVHPTCGACFTAPPRPAPGQGGLVGFSWHGGGARWGGQPRFSMTPLRQSSSPKAKALHAACILFCVSASLPTAECPPSSHWPEPRPTMGYQLIGAHIPEGSVCLGTQGCFLAQQLRPAAEAKALSTLSLGVSELKTPCPL